MTKMLDVFEAFLNYHGHLYLRLDGTTRVDQRQVGYLYHFIVFGEYLSIINMLLQVGTLITSCTFFIL